MNGHRLVILLVVLLSAGSAGGWGEPHVFAKPGRTALRPGLNPGVVEMKLTGGSGIRLENGGFTGGSGDPQGLAGLLGSWPGAEVTPLFSRAPEDLRSAVSLTGQPVYDLSLFYRISLPPGVPSDKASDALNALAEVEVAYPAPVPLPPPGMIEAVATGFYEPLQGYLDPAPGGLGVRFAWDLHGGRGNRIRVVDVEYSWNFLHEDLAGVRDSLIGPDPTDPFGSDHHGTAVLGVLAASWNNLGVTGLVTGASVGTVAAFHGGEYRLADAVDLGASALGVGDILLIEQQVAGPRYTGNGQRGVVAAEWVESVFAAVYNASAKGVIVVEPAGNGGENLDDPIYLSRFTSASRDSGALFVGAGAPPNDSLTADRMRLPMSNFGSRVNLQGWGANVVTTGYGDLHSEGGKNAFYTQRFSGTSSAAATVAGAIGVLQGIYHARTMSYLLPLEMREILVTTGSPQQNVPSTNVEWIGPRPNLRGALEALFQDMPTPTPTMPDTDGDGIPDLQEGGKAPGPGKTNRYLPDSDGDGLGDGMEDQNRNGDWESDLETSPRDRDTDGDRLGDGLEVRYTGSDPRDAFSPAEGPVDEDGDELPAALDPDDGDRDVDRDRFLDGYEAVVLTLNAVAESNSRPGLCDVNHDQFRDNADAQLVLNFFAGANAAGVDGGRSDANRDGTIDNADSQLLLNFFGSILNWLPAGVEVGGSETLLREGSRGDLR